jgi:uncharacterized protein YkwD
MPVPEAVRLRRRKRMRGLLMVALVLGVTAVWDQFGRSDAESKGERIRLRPNPIEMRLLERVNQVRERAGKPPLAFSAPLMKAAYFHSADMAASGYLAHDSPAGDSPVDRIRFQGLNYEELGENLFTGSHDTLARLADNALARWMADPRDRINLLSADFRTTGIGAARAPDGSFYITQDLLR